MKVSLLYSPTSRVVHEWLLDVPCRTSAWGVIESSGLLALLPHAQPSNLQLGVWGLPVNANTLMQAGDRLEVYRGLLVDPKLARRERFKRQGSKGAGLFAGLRAGGKAGY